VTGNDPQENKFDPESLGNLFKCLDFEQISLIDEAIESVGAYGEVHLVVQKGRLRYVVTQKSYDALKFSGDEFNHE
jgi:hypothetical protein